MGFGMVVSCCGGIAPMLKIDVFAEASTVVAWDVLIESLAFACVPVGTCKLLMYCTCGKGCCWVLYYGPLFEARLLRV